MSVADATCEPVILLGASRRQRLAQWLQQAFEDWRQQWSGNLHGSLDVEIAETLCRRPTVPGGRLLGFGADIAAGPLLVAAVSMEMQSELLGVATSRTVGDGAGETANAVFAEAMHALCLRVTRTKGVDAVNATSLAGDKLAHRWCEYGLTVTVKTGGDRVLLRLRLFPSLVLALLPSQASKPTDALASRRSAIGNETVDVRAWLGEAEVTLGELANLQVGDVIVLDTSVSGAGHLSLPDGRHLAPISLGRAAGHRAVSVVGKTAGQSGR